MFGKKYVHIFAAANAIDDDDMDIDMDRVSHSGSGSGVNVAQSSDDGEAIQAAATRHFHAPSRVSDNTGRLKIQSNRCV